MFTLFVPGFQPLSNLGAIVPGGRLVFKESGTDTPKTVYHDADGSTPWDDPVVLDGSGRAIVFLNSDGAYDIDFFEPEVVGVPDGDPIWSLVSYGQPGFEP